MTGGPQGRAPLRSGGMGITVQSLTYYPVKGCAGTSVESARVGATGLEHDRTFMVVDAVDGSFRSQRKTPAIDRTWQSLGTYRFEAGTAGSITISNEGTDGHVIVDAVQLLPVE